MADTEAPSVVGAEPAAEAPAAAETGEVSLETTEAPAPAAEGEEGGGAAGDAATATGDAAPTNLSEDAEPDAAAKAAEDDSASAADAACVVWVRSRFELLAPADAEDAEAWLTSLWNDESDATVSEFLQSVTCRAIFAYVLEGALHLTAAPPADLPSSTACMYCARDPAKFITVKNIDRVVTCGKFFGSPQDSLLRLMSNVYVPSVVQNKSWPDSVKKDFSGQLHKFMAQLTESANLSLRGQTVLYVPAEPLGEPREVAKEKDLVQRLESTLIHWTRQIKEVVGTQDNSEQLEEDPGPLSEIEFWRNRSVDLSGIRAQLSLPDVAAITAVLEHAKSSYLPTFRSLSGAIQREAAAAEDNLKFLTLLEEPCIKLSKAEPKDIPPIFPSLLHRIRMIWNYSGFYNTDTRLISLLRKVSNEIINRCRAHISLPDIFEGDVESCMEVLRESILAGEAWKAAYNRTADAITNANEAAWEFDRTGSIFANIDAFVQRCRDLQEVCEAQIQFQPKRELPCFGGTRGPELTKSLADIQTQFGRLAHTLRTLNYSVLDVKATRWHDDYNTFKSGVRDLEVMLVNQIILAFEICGGLRPRVELLEAFNSLAKREQIKRCVEKKTAETYQAFFAELTTVKKHFDYYRRSPPLNRKSMLPRYSGAAVWADGLKRRLVGPYEVLERASKLLPDAPESADLAHAHALAVESINAYIQSQHAEWVATIDPNYPKKLENSLMTQTESERGSLLMNFDKSLLSLFQETLYWERLHMEIPLVAMEIAASRERFRVLRENVMLVVRDYNRILSYLNESERQLFADRINYLDRRIAPGIHRLNWTSQKHHLDFFLREAKKYCREVETTVLEYKAANDKIAKACKEISETLLVSIERKRVYGEGEFEKRQSEIREAARAKFERLHQDVRQQMDRTYETFRGDSEDVQQEWIKYTRAVDKKMEDALRQTVKKSLQELSRALNGDAKTEVVPVFNVTVILDNASNRVELRPSVKELFDMVHSTSRDLITCIQVVPRLAESRGTRAQEGSAAAAAAAKESEELPSFYQTVSSDEDTTLKTIVAITAGVSGIVDKVQQFLGYYEKKFKHVWEADKEAYIRRYEKARKPLSAFSSDISKYKDIAEDVVAEDSSTNMRFLRIDVSPLKQSLVAHCEGWVTRFTGLLNSMAKTELMELHDQFSSSTRTLAVPVTSLDMLADQVNLQVKLTHELDSVEARFQPLHDKYKTLERFEAGVTDEENALLESLESKWEDYKSMLLAAEETLATAKEGFRERVAKMSDAFTREVAETRETFQTVAPFTNEGFDVESAKAFIAKEKEALAARRKSGADIKKGMDIFAMAQPPYKEMSDTEKELDLMENLWGIVAEWEGNYNSWKGGLFREILVEGMETTAVTISKKIVKIGRDIRAWPAWAWIKDVVDSFKKTMPLIVDLRNEALRERHWEQLMDAVGERFDPAGDDFTLNRVVELRLADHAELIMDLATNATKELAIELSLKAIGELWEGTPEQDPLRLDMQPFKEFKEGSTKHMIYRLRSTEDVNAALEDNVVTLSTMKASKYFMVFEEIILKREQQLSLVGEVVEITLNVQKAWSYLENIFIGSEDIRRQLPGESRMFDGVHMSYIKKMAFMANVSKALPACTAPGLLEAFQDMEMKLEKIQKSLDAYLESKRMAFPRFYFLSSDDLLEILGQAKDPQMVQQHLKKCFEGVAKLDMQMPGQDGRRHCESIGMSSPDGEYVPFNTPAQTEGRPEEWLNRVEAAMYAATKKYLHRTLEERKSMKVERWVGDFLGQTVISAGQVIWTTECEKSLSDPDLAKSALRQLKKKWVSYLNRLVGITRGKVSKIMRKKVVALITIEVHARDVIEKLGKSGCSSTADFEWLSQLRFYWENNDCIVRQVLSIFTYGYEYQGNNGRLVMTPLTDRCYMTLGAALFTRRGGNPLGPAGTGKTETVKDFGKALARYVIVFNCSDGVDFMMTAKMFSGLAQTGAWACLDEFNRIEVEVLSVVASQISVVMLAIKENRSHFDFYGQTIRLIPSCGIFVTMNPGYAGRSELPDNLKAIVRPVSMMVPDFTLIAEIMLFAEGFSTAKILSKKMISIMELSQQQLSKQDHYDYGLRSFVIPIARAAGNLKRVEVDASEEVIMFRTMIDLIKPKLVYADLPLFMALLGDLFPGVELPPNDGGILRKILEEELVNNNLQVVHEFVIKMIQIFDCKVARHGNMIVGRTGAGKSEAWKCLTRAMARLKDMVPEDENYQRVHVYPINPLALSNDEMYGYFNSNNEWQDGILARVFRTICREETPDQKWILFDGPVDTLWIESMNTTLDDNKLLTLLSGERIAMPPQVSLLFEVEDLSQASPATVSRAGMVYTNTEDLGLQPFLTSWLATKASDAVLKETLARMVEKYIEPVTEYKRLNCAETVPIDPLNGVRTCVRLFDSLCNKANGVEEGTDTYVPMIELTFLFSVIWSIGASLDNDSRKKFDLWMREMDSRYPAQDTVYDVFVHPTKKTWAPWDEKLSANYRPDVNNTPFFQLMVPTVDSVRTKFVLLKLLSDPTLKTHCLVTGEVGVGKTLIIQDTLASLPEGKGSFVVNFSAQSSSNSLQDAIEGRLEKRTKGVFAPTGGKKLVVHVDDFNMPQLSAFGFLPPLELLKLWIDNGFWYDRLKCEVKQVKELQILGSMAPPGGGRNPFSMRVQAAFSLINVTTPNDNQLKRIFGTLLAAKLSDFDEEIKPLAEPITAASVMVYKTIVSEMLPVPGKEIYLFNTRDLSKVIQGVMQATKQYYDSKESMLQLWCHESFRIYADRMWDFKDKGWVQNQLDSKLDSVFTLRYENLFENNNNECPPFVSFMRQVDHPPYEAVTDMPALKAFLIEKLEDYALEPGKTAMDLVLFKDALLHCCRLHRVLQQPKGNSLLVGVGGSGRKSLAKLTAYVADLKCFMVEITKTYRLNEFHEDLKTLFRQAGVENKPSVFLFDDSQVVTEVFLEDINNILTSGEVPNLFTKDEVGGVCEDVRAAAKAANAGETQDQLFSFFLKRVAANLHVVLCLSPVGEAFRERTRMFPGLVNCMTIDWFTEWPNDALFEVAQKQLEEEKIDADVKDNIAKVMVTAHSSVSEAAADMEEKLKRKTFVTPTNYLAFVRGYRGLLEEKRKELVDKKFKLSGGLEKLDETGVQVQEMQVVCEEKKVIVAQAKVDCEALLVEIVQDKRVADEQEKQVNAEAAKIAKEAGEAELIAKECQEGLDKAMPALNAATEALNVLTKKDVSELKAYSKPPPAVELTLSAVLTTLKRPPGWDEAKKQMGDANFLLKLIEYDKDQLQDALLKKIKKFTDNPDFMPEAVGKVSGAAKGMCLWVRAMETYGHVAKEVAPKREKLKQATQAVEKKQKQLKQAQAQLAEVLAKVQALKDTYDESTSQKEKLQTESDELEAKLIRAEKLVNGLAGERTRWEQSIVLFEEELGYLPGDVVVAAAFLSYAGPFPSEYRNELVGQTWLPQVKTLAIPSSAEFSFSNFLANPSDVRDWNIQGLPADAFSTENGVIVARCTRWPLMIDPQGQANKWVRNMEASKQVDVVSHGTGDMMRRMENAIQFGTPVLLQDVLETLDPSLEPVLSKQLVKKGNAYIIKLGDKEVDYDPAFKLYITTKMQNPTYEPTISTKVTITNFAVKEDGLEAQLLNTVVRKERPDLDKQKNELVVKVAAGKRTQVELEDQILYMLSTATGSLLDNVELLNALDQSKITFEEVNESLKVAEETSIMIEEASNGYRPVSIRAAVLYFVLNDLASIDPMYQFSLDAYNELMLLSISKAQKSENLQERIRFLNDYHTYAVYKYTARGLFGRHKLLLSLQICVRILQKANQVNQDEWQFFLRGGSVLDRSTQQKNPDPSWISEEAWDNITELENIPHFKGIVASFEGNVAQWEKDWYRQGDPESAELPGEWESKCNELQRMIIVRCLRVDRVMFAATSYVANALGRKYVEPPGLDLGETHADSVPTSPLIFVLSPGVDPTTELRRLAETKGLGDKFHTIALGQGQAPIATKLIEEGLKEGTWVFLANCHLMTSWLPALDKIIEAFEKADPNPNFRLWLSSNPSPDFPIAILQRGIKMTTEPPKGLRANLLRLYNTITEESYAECRTQHKYNKLLFSLTYFHSTILERRKFRNLGLNIPYDFSDTDYVVSDDLLKVYLDEYEETPWDALKYLISEANYGGRVTDEIDRRVLRSYLDQFYCEDALSIPNYPLSSLSIYYIPEPGPLQTYKDYIMTLPTNDSPEAFGQHGNAEIAFQIEDSKIVLESLVSLQPQDASGGDGEGGAEQMVYDLCEDLLNTIPKAWNLENVMKAKADDPSALHVVLFQEVERYNVLLDRIHADCKAVQRGIKGLVVMSAELDAIFNAFDKARVPGKWLKTYPTLKPLGSWSRDLLQRWTELNTWIEQTYPRVYWLSGFTYPTGFLTAVLQTTARKSAIPIDTLSWDFSIINLDEKEITQPPRDGVYVRGTFLEGAGWDFENGCLCEPDPMELIVTMPIIHFKPIENKKKVGRGIYQCPLYLYPLRTGSRERPSFMVMVELRSGSVDPEH